MDQSTFDTIRMLVLKRLHGELSEAETATLNSWIAENPSYTEMLQQLDNAEALRSLLQHYREANDALDRKLYSAIPEINIQQNIIAPKGRIISFPRWVWAAAAVLLIITGAYLFTTTVPKKPVVDNKIHAPEDIQPGTNKALLTLSDGSTITLDSAGNGAIAQQGNSSIIKLSNGKIQYRSGNTASHNVMMNTMSTPRGGQYQVSLPDGTKVWLNAASSITYPVVFAGNERKVKITGEVYFEVARNKTQPFIVETPKDEIVVLGTSFNINSYTDEPYSKTTLLDGAIKINQQILRPGQAYVQGKVTATNVQQDIAWKNGYFNFNGADAAAVMRQISRWYNVDVVYNGKIPQDKFRGELSRDLTLSQILEILKDVNIHFEIDQKTLRVN